MWTENLLLDKLDKSSCRESPVMPTRCSRFAKSLRISCVLRLCQGKTKKKKKKRNLPKLSVSPVGSSIILFFLSCPLKSPHRFNVTDRGDETLRSSDSCSTLLPIDPVPCSHRQSWLWTAGAINLLSLGQRQAVGRRTQTSHPSGHRQRKGKKERCADTTHGRPHGLADLKEKTKTPFKIFYLCTRIIVI